MMSFVWFALVVLCLIMYVVLDGYDLGIGAATLLERDDTRRREMLELVAQAWDGNETWLVLLGVSLWAGFPLAFGTILPHAYLPLVAMLFSLIVRGVSVEMASQAPPAKAWTRAFGVASLTAALAQGVALGTLADQVTFVDSGATGSVAGAPGWFGALTAAAVTCSYLALGHAYLKWKSVGEMATTAARRGTVSAVSAAVLGAACLVALNASAAPLNLTDPGRAASFTALMLFAVIGIAVAVLALRPSSRHDGLPLAGLVVAVVAVALAVVVARYPVLLPPRLTLADAVSPGPTMTFLAVGIGLNVPLVLFYTWYAHHAFRGKLTAEPRPPGATNER